MDSAAPVPPAARAISREDLAKLPIRRYEGRVCLVRSAADLEAARADLREEAVVGLDTETRPAFRKGERHPPALVQAATARAVYLFPLRGQDAYPLLGSLLSEERPLKAGVALRDDLRELATLFPFEPRGLVDLGLAARRAGMHQTGVRNLAALFLGLRIPKGIKTSNWAARELTPAQITYAATDAWACRELYLRFAGLGWL